MMMYNVVLMDYQFFLNILELIYQLLVFVLLDSIYDLINNQSLVVL